MCSTSFWSFVLIYDFFIDFLRFTLFFFDIVYVLVAFHRGTKTRSIVPWWDLLFSITLLVRGLGFNDFDVFYRSSVVFSLNPTCCLVCALRFVRSLNPLNIYIFFFFKASIVLLVLCLVWWKWSLNKFVKLFCRWTSENGVDLWSNRVGCWGDMADSSNPGVRNTYSR